MQRLLDHVVAELLRERWLRYDGLCFSAAHPSVASLVLAAADGGGADAEALKRVHRGLGGDLWGSSKEMPASRVRNQSEMIAIAERIAQGFDFLRVDLYDVDGHVWFGETTAYPMSGLGRYSPDSFDEELGSWWTLPDL